MEFVSQIWPAIEDKAKQYFSSELIRKGKDLLDSARLSISFKKGRLGSFFVISGLISDGVSVDTKLKGKSADGGDQKIEGHCSCVEWSKENHCRHMTALFLKFVLDEHFEDGISPLKKDPSAEGIQQALKNTQSVHVKDFGTLVFQANRLMNAPFNGSFVNLQYLLTSGKLTHFPLGKPWEGQLQIRLIERPTKNLNPDFYGPNHRLCRFAWIDGKGDLREKISLFDYFHLFDWETGEVFQLPPEIQGFIKKIKAPQVQYGIEDFIRLTWPIVRSEKANLLLEGRALVVQPEETLKLDLAILDSSRKNFFRFELGLKDSENLNYAFPEVFSLFCFHKGLLSFFSNRTEMNQFVKSALSYLNDAGNFEKTFSPSKEKDYATDWLQFLKQEEDIPVYDHGKLYKLSKQTIVSFFTEIQKLFSTGPFRSSEKSADNRSYILEVPQNVVHEHLATLFESFKTIGVELTFRRKQVHSWQASPVLERKNSQLGWFDLTMKISEQDREVLRNLSPDNVLVETSQGLVMLSDEQKGLVKILKRYQKFDGEEQKDSEGQVFNLTLNRARIFELFELERLGIQGALTDEEREICRQLSNLEELPNYETPVRFQKLARSYQKTGHRWLRFLYESRFGACLADDMGLGKTLQVIMLLDDLKEKFKRVLIVCPVSIISNWESELKKFSDFEAELYYGEGRVLSWDKKIVITSYGIMKKEVDDIWSKQNIDIVIFDEIQQLKNIKSMGAQAARRINAQFRVALTGTPVENDLMEFYNILDLCIPGIWGDLTGARSKNSQKARLLARKTARPFILRRTKEKVLSELPEKVEQHVYLDFSPQEKQRYQQHLIDIRETLQSAEKKSYYGMVLRSLLELRKMCLWQPGPEILSTKIDYLMENLEQLLEEGHRSIIFSQFTSYLDVIQKRFEQRKWKYARVDGQQSLAKRAEQIDNFQKGGPPLFLISLKAGGVGLNLTAASYVFIMDPWWNPAVENQAIDRAYRIGQKNKVTVYRPLIKDSVEEKVLILQDEKRKLFDDLMNPTKDDSFYDGKLSKDDFQHLLSE